MAKYNTPIYNSGFKYGTASNTTAYYNANVVAKATTYGTVSVNWSTITWPSTDPAPTYWMLVKSYTSTLDNPNDAFKVAGGPYSSSGTGSLAVYTGYGSNYIDINYDSVGKEASYSIWVFDGSIWHFCGDSYAKIVEDKDSLIQISSWLPRVWFNDAESLDQTGVPNSGNTGDTNTTFYKVMLQFAFMYDLFRTEGELLAKSNNFAYTPNSFLYPKILDFGFTYQPSLGDSYHRSLASAGNVISSYRGQPLGLKNYTAASTHLENTVTTGLNLMLTYNDSSFEESLGAWNVSSGTFTQNTYTKDSNGNYTGTFPATLYPTTMVYDTAFLPRSVGYAKLATAATTAITMSLPSSAADITTYGIPVSAGTNYIFSGYITHQTGGVSATITAQIAWYTYTGLYISTTAVGPTTTSSIAWQRFSTYTGLVGNIAPINASFARAILTITPSAATATNYAFDYLQFKVANQSLYFEDSRTIHLAIKGEGENYLPNPDFESPVSAATLVSTGSLHSWSGLNGTLVLDTTNVVHGTYSAKLTATANASSSVYVGYVTDWVPVDPGTLFTFSAYITAGTSQPAYVQIEFSNQPSYQTSSNGNSIIPVSTGTIYSDANGQYYPSTIYTQTNNATIGTTTTQLGVTAIAPQYDQDSGMPLAKCSVYFPNATTGQTFWIDAAMLEPSSTVNNYYSGNGGVTPTDPTTTLYHNINNCLWENKVISNLMSNSSFETDTSDWSAGTGTTIAKSSSDNGYTLSYDGTSWGKVTYTTTGTITGTYYLPGAALGGEDVVISAYVRGAASTAYTYTIGSSTFTVPAAQSSNWTRINTVQTLAAGATAPTFVITGTGSTYFHVDAVQVEYGRIPNQFLVTSSPTVSLPNPLNTAKTIWSAKRASIGSGKGSYFYNYSVKAARLKSSLGSLVALGNSWRLDSGVSTPGYSDLTSSLVPNSSFESSLGNWSGVSATLTRQVSRGMLFGDNVSHGQAYARVLSAGTGSSFGITTGNVYIPGNTKLYLSVAIRPETAAVGTFTLTTTFYNTAGTAVWSATTGYPTNTPVTATVTQTNRWAYLGTTFYTSNLVGAAYAVISVTCAPTGGNSNTVAFGIDRVVLRPVY